jgi:phospholipid transport system substrate-binding protein
MYKNRKGQWKSYDLELLGVSIVQTYRTQFENALKGKTAADLLNKMGKQGEFKIPEGKGKKK